MEESIKLLKELNTEDPTIVLNGQNIEIIPSLFNYAFLINCISFPVFLLGFLAGYIFISVIGSLIFLFNIGYFLRFSNKLIVNQENKTVTIIPNLIWRRFIKSQRIDFEKIKDFSIGYYIQSLSYRHLIKLRLFASEEIKIITVSSKRTAEIITNALNRLT